MSEPSDTPQPCTAGIATPDGTVHCVLPAGHEDPEHGNAHAGPGDPFMRLCWFDWAEGATPHQPSPDEQADEGQPEPPSEEELNAALPVRPDPRQPAYDAVYEYIRGLGEYMPRDTVHRNAVIWRAVNAALAATPVGRCVSSHCVEGDHILDLGETP